MNACTSCIETSCIKILGSESFARWLVSLALVLELELELVLELELELMLALELQLELALELELVLALDIEHYRITASVLNNIFNLLPLILSLTVFVIVLARRSFEG